LRVFFHFNVVKDPVRIDLLKGFCDLPFGAPISRAIELFGEPEEIQTLEEDILNNRSLVYHYWDSGFSLFFDLNRDKTFRSVELDNKATLLFGREIFTLSEKELVALMKEHGYVLSDTEVHQWGEKRLSFDEAGFDCYFEHNKMVTADFGVIDFGPGFSYFPN
jgi:hypothetical protein